jgi:hypothetical protein
MRRGWLLLAVAGIVASIAGCGGQSQALAPGGEARQFPSQTATESPSRPTAPPVTGRPGPPQGSALAGSFLMDLTWVSDQRGWALAAAPCAGGLCPRVAATGDGGRSWTALPVPPGFIQDANGTVNCDRVACVSQIRFATARVGYLFGPALFQTDDGGRSWQRKPSRPVEALEPSAGTVVRIVYDHGGCPGPCTRAVQETTAGSGTWHTLLRIPFASSSGSVAAQLVRQGSSVLYLPIYGHVAGGAGTAHTVTFRSTDGGNSWQQLADPCGGTGRNEHDASGLAAAPGGFVAVLCQPRAGTGLTFVLTSADYGSSWSPPRVVPGGTPHYLNLIAAASPGRLVVATGGVQGSGPFTYRLVASADGGLRWSTAITGATQVNPWAPGASFLGFEDSRVGRWISDERDIWTTRDGGRRWLRRAFP